MSDVARRKLIVSCGHDWLEGESPGNALLCILPARHSAPHLYCREEDIFGDTPNRNAVDFLRQLIAAGLHDLEKRDKLAADLARLIHLQSMAQSFIPPWGT